MDGIISAPMLPYRWGPTWRAVLQNYPRRGMRIMNESPAKRVIDYPPSPPPIDRHGFKVELTPWVLIRKPHIREYFRATALVSDPAEGPVIEQYLIVDPYDLKISMMKLEDKIARFMFRALEMGYELRMREARIYED